MRALLLVLAACGGNIRLGEDPPDAASIDAPHGAFNSGSYSASFLDPAQISCQGTLSGHEADFSAITRATSSFVDGPVQLQLAADAVIVTGNPIATGFGQASVSLAPDPQASPLWTIAVAVTLGGGPDATQAVGVGLALDSSTASSPTGIQGEIARVFATANNDGQCSVTFGALLVSN
jgi:hypothetical protein